MAATFTDTMATIVFDAHHDPDLVTVDRLLDAISIGADEHEPARDLIINEMVWKLVERGITAEAAPGVIAPHFIRTGPGAWRRYCDTTVNEVVDFVGWTAGQLVARLDAHKAFLRVLDEAADASGWTEQRHRTLSELSDEQRFAFEARMGTGLTQFEEDVLDLDDLLAESRGRPRHRHRQPPARRNPVTTDQTTTDQTTTDQQGDITMEMSDTAAERLSERPELSNHPAVRAARRLRRAWRYHNLQGIHASATEMIEEWSKDPVLANVHSFLEDYADIHFDDLVGFFTNIGDGANQLRILDAQYDWAGEEHQWVPIRVDDPEAIVATLRTHVPPNVLDDVVKRLVLDHFSDA